MQNTKQERLACWEVQESSSSHGPSSVTLAISKSQGVPSLRPLPEAFLLLLSICGLCECQGELPRRSTCNLQTSTRDAVPAGKQVVWSGFSGGRPSKCKEGLSLHRVIYRFRLKKARSQPPICMQIRGCRSLSNPSPGSTHHVPVCALGPSHLSKMICTLHENQIQKFRGKLSSTNFTWPRRPVATACLSQGFADIPSLRSETRSPRTAGMPPAMASTARARTLLTRSSCSQQKHPTRSSESHGRQTELFFFVPGELTCMSRRGLYRSMQRTQPWQKRSCEGHRAAEAHIQELAPLGGASQKHPAVSERSGSRSPARRENLRLHDKVTHA